MASDQDSNTHRIVVQTLDTLLLVSAIVLGLSIIFLSGGTDYAAPLLLGIG
jgi:hypothetical protein